MRPALLTTVLALALPAFAEAADAPKRPNILFIMADDHAAHALSCYGSAIGAIPSLHRLEAESKDTDRSEQDRPTIEVDGPPVKS
jgi:hypothetical protein